MTIQKIKAILNDFNSGISIEDIATTHNVHMVDIKSPLVFLMHNEAMSMIYFRHRGRVIIPIEEAANWGELPKCYPVMERKDVSTKRYNPEV